MAGERCEHVIAAEASAIDREGRKVGVVGELRCHLFADVKLRGKWRCFPHYTAFVKKEGVKPNEIMAINDATDIRCGYTVGYTCANPPITSTTSPFTGFTIFICAGHALEKAEKERKQEAERKRAESQALDSVPREPHL